MEIDDTRRAPTGKGEQSGVNRNDGHVEDGERLRNNDVVGFEVLYVCTGNVCRSPMAEALFGHHLRAGSGVRVSSAGTQALVGSGMDPASAEALRELGVDGSAHRARQFEPRMAFSADLILTAEIAHRDLVMTAVPSAFRRTFTLQEFARLVGRPGQLEPTPPADPAGLVAQAAAVRHLDGPVGDGADDVPDPYRAELAVARAVAAQIAATVATTLTALGVAAERPPAGAARYVPPPPAPRPRPRPAPGATAARPRPVPRNS